MNTIILPMKGLDDDSMNQESRRKQQRSFLAQEMMSVSCAGAVSRAFWNPYRLMGSVDWGLRTAKKTRAGTFWRCANNLLTQTTYHTSHSWSQFAATHLRTEQYFLITTANPNQRLSAPAKHNRQHPTHSKRIRKDPSHLPQAHPK